MSEEKKDKPIVYSCSGSSTAAQTCNEVALRLDHEGHATMSCIAGVGGDVKALVKIAKSGRKIIALDGCALKCTINTLKRHGIEPDIIFELSEHGVKKVHGKRFDPEQAQAIYEKVLKAIS